MNKFVMVYFGVSAIQLGAAAFNYLMIKRSNAFKSDEQFLEVEQALVSHFKPLLNEELGLTNVEYYLNAHQKLIAENFNGYHTLGYTANGYVTKGFFLRERAVVAELYRQAISKCVLFKGLGKFDMEQYAMLYVNILAHELRHVRQFTVEGYSFDDLEGTAYSLLQRGVRKEVERVAKTFGNQYAKAHEEEIRAIVRKLNK